MKIDAYHGDDVCGLLTSNAELESLLVRFYLTIDGKEQNEGK